MQEKASYEGNYICPQMAHFKTVEKGLFNAMKSLHSFFCAHGWLQFEDERDHIFAIQQAPDSSDCQEVYLYNVKDFYVTNGLKRAQRYGETCRERKNQSQVGGFGQMCKFKEHCAKGVECSFLHTVDKRY